MKKNATLFLLLVMLTCPVLASTPSSTTITPANTTGPGPDAVKSALSEFKSLKRSERRARIKEVKKVIKEYKANKKAGKRDTDTDTILLVILAILLPPLAVYLHENELNTKFWISLVLSLLVILLWPLWFIAIAFALLVVLDAI